MQAIKVLNMIKLFGKAIRVNKASQDKDTLDVGANLFIGNLDPDVDEKVCHRNCSTLCSILYPASYILLLNIACISRFHLPKAMVLTKRTELLNVQKMLNRHGRIYTTCSSKSGRC